MLIEIDISVVDCASKGELHSVRALQSIATSQSYGYHVVWAQRNTLKKIVALSMLSDLDISIYRSILNKYATITSDYKKINFRLLVSTLQTTKIESNQIIINPNQYPNFNYVNRAQLLAENLLDINLFRYIGLFFLRECKLENTIKLEFDDELGGGDTTHTNYKKHVDNSEKFCLCILDSDREYENSTYGNTFKKVQKCHNNSKPFNCMCYGTEKLREIENLIPYYLYLSDSNYQHTQIVKEQLKFDLSFFDLKEGLKCKCITDQNSLNYWRNVLSSYKHIIDNIDAAVSFMNTDIDEYKRVYDKEVFIEGFGVNLLKHILNSKKSELEKITTKELTDSQVHEWNRIGKLMLYWGCAVTIPKIPLV